MFHRSANLSFMADFSYLLTYRYSELFLPNTSVFNSGFNLL